MEGRTSSAVSISTTARATPVSATTVATTTAAAAVLSEVAATKLGAAATPAGLAPTKASGAGGHAGQPPWHLLIGLLHSQDPFRKLACCADVAHTASSPSLSAYASTDILSLSLNSASDSFF